MSAKLKTLSLSILLSLPLASYALERLSLLPSEAQSYVRVSNTTNFWSMLKQSSIGTLWADPQFQDFLGNPDAETWTELFFEDDYDAEDEVFMEQIKMLQGEIILAFDTEMEDPYIIAAMSKADFLKSLEMDEKLREITDEPFEIVKSEFQDVKIIQYVEDGGSADEESSWQAHLNGTLVLGYTKEWVEKCIVQLKKEEIKEPTGNPVANLNIPLSSLLSTLAEEEGATAMDTDLLFEALGLTGIKDYSLKLELKETEMVADSNLRVADLTKGLFSILDTRPSELPTVTFIPENISSMEVGRFNLLRFWQEIPNALATAMPSARPQFDMIVAMLQQQAGINLEQDVLAHLDTQYLSFSEVKGEIQTTVVAVELKNSMAFKSGLETAIAAPALQPQVAAGLEIEEFLDHTIYTVKGNDPENPVAFGISGDYLLYSQPNGLRQAIRSQSSDAAANTAFERSELVRGLRQHVPPRAFGFSVIDWKKNMDVMVREISKPEYVAIMQQSWATSGSPLPPPDFSKLPTADHIASFFNVSYQYIEATDDGLHQRFILKY
jgi:hypothetical protein